MSMRSKGRAVCSLCAAMLEGFLVMAGVILFVGGIGGVVLLLGAPRTLGIVLGCLLTLLFFREIGPDGFGRLAKIVLRYLGIVAVLMAAPSLGVPHGFQFFALWTATVSVFVLSFIASAVLTPAVHRQHRQGFLNGGTRSTAAVSVLGRIGHLSRSVGQDIAWAGVIVAGWCAFGNPTDPITGDPTTLGSVSVIPAVFELALWRAQMARRTTR